MHLSLKMAFLYGKGLKFDEGMHNTDYTKIARHNKFYIRLHVLLACAVPCRPSVARCPGAWRGR